MRTASRLESSRLPPAIPRVIRFDSRRSCLTVPLLSSLPLPSLLLARAGVTSVPRARSSAQSGNESTSAGRIDAAPRRDATTQTRMQRAQRTSDKRRKEHRPQQSSSGTVLTVLSLDAESNSRHEPAKTTREWRRAHCWTGERRANERRSACTHNVLSAWLDSTDRSPPLHSIRTSLSRTQHSARP